MVTDFTVGYCCVPLTTVSQCLVVNAYSVLQLQLVQAGLVQLVGTGHRRIMHGPSLVQKRFRIMQGLSLVQKRFWVMRGLNLVQMRFSSLRVAALITTMRPVI